MQMKPTYRQLSFQDIDFIHKGYRIQNIEGRAVQLEPGSLHIELKELRLPDLFMRYFKTNKSITTEEFHPPGSWTRFFLVPKLESSLPNWCGVTVRPYNLVIFRPGREHLCKLPSGYHNIDFTISNAFLESQDIAPNWLIEKANEPGTVQLQLHATYGDCLFKRMYMLLQINESLDTLLANPHRAVQYQQYISDELKRAIYGSAGSIMRRLSAKPYRRYPIVKKAIEYVRNRNDEYLSVRDLTQELEVGSRRMERAFREVLGISPYQYLLRERLNAALMDIRHGRPGQGVTDIALRYGFASGSEFAKHFRRFFGEKPSQRLKNKNDRRKMTIHEQWL